MEAFYRAAVGAKRADYYAPKFMRFDQPGASKASWNWPAFFVAFFWGLYRRMYGKSLLFCVVIPYALLIAFRLLFAFSHLPYPALLTLIASVVYSWLLIPMYANAFYHQTIVRRIKEVQSKVDDPAVQIAVLENGSHTSTLAWVIVLFALVPVTGMLAAIAIPAYQDYTIRSQVSEGLMLSAPLERAIVTAYSANGSWPTDLAAVKFHEPVSGSYVAAIDVIHGTILIRFGNGANPLLKDQVLTLRPTLNDRSVVWSCGYAIPPGNNAPDSPLEAESTTVPKKFLPVMCRG